MKRIFKALSVVFVLIITISATSSFAVLAAPAPAVTSLQITGATISSGNVYVTVKVTGYGNEYAWWDGKLVGPRETSNIITSNGVDVIGWSDTYNCGTATKGTHTFKFSDTSWNRPWNTLSVSATYNIS
jgi:hypothetical protein